VESAEGHHSCQLAAPWGGLYLRDVPVLPESPRYRAKSFDADPLRYLRGVLVGFLGAGTLVALVLAVTGVTPRALLLAGLLWAMFGLLTGLVDYVMTPLADLVGEVFGGASLSAEAQQVRLATLLETAEELAGPLEQPEAAVRELERMQRKADRLAPADDIRLGLALAGLYERRLQDPGRALGELRRLIDRHPQLRETVRVRELLANLRAQHFSQPAA